MTAVLICYDLNETCGTKIRDELQHFWEAEFSGDQKLIAYRKGYQIADLSELCVSPRLIILHLNDPDASRSPFEDAVQAQAFPLVYVTNGSAPKVNQVSHPCLGNVGGQIPVLTEFVRIWGTKFNFEPQKLLAAWADVPATRHERQRAFADELLFSLAGMDILIQGYLAIHSNQEEWKAIRELPDVEINIAAAKHRTEPKRLWRIKDDVERFLAEVCVERAEQIEWWFDPILPEVLRKGDQAIVFEEKANELLMEVLSETMSLESMGSQEEVMSCVDCGKSVDAARKWVKFLNPEGLDASPSGGAMRLCWELAKGGGYFDTLDASTLESVALCQLFEAAHQEYALCCKFLSKIHHE